MHKERDLPAKFLDKALGVLGYLPRKINSVYPLQDQIVGLHRVSPSKWRAKQNDIYKYCPKAQLM